MLSAEHANKATGALKNAILEAMSHTGSTRVDLFFAGPAFLALLLRSPDKRRGNRATLRVEVARGLRSHV